MFKLICAVVTPFNADFTIDYLGFKRIVDKLILDGVDGIVVGGTTGEAPTLTHKEKKKLYEYASVLCKDRISLYLGIGSNDTISTLEFVELIDYISCDGYLCVVPYYNKPSQKGLFEHFRLISNKTKKDIFLYNIPGRTGISLNIDTILKLAEIDNIKGIKEASDNFALMKEIKEKTNLQVFIGEDALIYEAFKRNMDGVISVSCHLFTKEIRKLLDSNDELGFYTYKIRFRALFDEPNPVMIKALLHKKELINDYVRLPHVKIDEKMVEMYHKFIINDEKLV